MADLSDVVKVGSGDSYLAVVSTTRRDGSVLSSVVNAGVVAHPVTGSQVVGTVFVGGVRKLAHLRERPRLTVTWRSGWSWVTAEGPVELIGPDDPYPGVSAERLRLLLRETFEGAGGTHDDWDEYDRVMAADRRVVVLLDPDRVYGS
jgi:PPOX class probable F420-dependent enzyme